MSNSVVKDCSIAATARAQLSQGDYSHGTTFWVGADESKPKTTLERLALNIFHSHLQRLLDRCKFSEEGQSQINVTNGIDMSNSGAEWWTLYMDEEDGGVGWHWDKDYHAELQEGKNIHPLVASVSYFSNVGAPTIVLPKKTVGPMASSDDYDSFDEPLPISRAYVSRPLNGKHMAFDGRLFHAAPNDFYDKVKQHDLFRNNNDHVQVKRGKRGPRLKRATFLVNVWINHKPRDAIRLDSCTYKLSSLAVSMDLLRPSPLYEIIIKKTNDPKKDQQGQKKKGKRREAQRNNSIETDILSTFTWELNDKYTLHTEMPIQAVAESWTKGDTFLISWNKGTNRPFITETSAE